MKKIIYLNKQGYYYSLDALIAIVIITVGILIVLQSNTHNQPKSNVILYAQDLSNFLSHTKIYDLNDELFLDTIQLWKQDGNITSFDNTILEQAGEFYTYKKMDKLESLLGNLSSNNYATTYNFNIWINGSIVYNHTTINQSMAKSVIVNKMIISGVGNKNLFWGPYIAEVRVWQ